MSGATLGTLFGSTHSVAGTRDLHNMDEVLFLRGERLDGTFGFFKIHRSWSWPIYCDLECSEDMSVEGQIYKTHDGRWVSQITRHSHSLVLYGIPEADPPVEVKEITIDQAAILLADPRRPTSVKQPTLPTELITYYETECADERPDIADRQMAASGSPRSSSGVHKGDGGIAFYETLDARRRSFDPSKAERWVGDWRYNSRFGSRLFR